MTSEASDLTVVRRAGRTAAVQASLALAVVLMVVGAVVFVVDVRVQDRQIADQLTSVAALADDVTDPPPGVQLVLRDVSGKVAASAAGLPLTDLLERAAGFSNVRVDGRPNRVLVVDKPQGRVVVLLALKPYEEARRRLLLALGAAELAGILASIAVVVLLTRRSIRPLADALALQRRFVADASHELRTPLTLLHTRVQMLARRFGDGDGDAGEFKNQIDALASDTRVLGEVVEDLLASAYMASNAIARVRVDVAEVADDVRASMGDHAAALGVRLTVTKVDSAQEGLVVLGSAAAIRRALTSLVDNALAHERPGGSVDIRVVRRADEVLAEVRDDGVGIDPAAKDDLFTTFSHGERHTSTGGRERYGIGLALVREIAMAHRGDIDVDQTPGGGATFRLTLPAAPAR